MNWTTLIVSYLLSTLVLLPPRVDAAVVIPPGPCARIQNAITSLPAAGGAIVLSAGVYTCTSPIVIDRHNVSLRGEGPATLIFLASHSNTPG